MNPNRSAVGIQPLCSAIQKFGSRLTHLYLAHNRLAGIPQLVAALSVRIPSITVVTKPLLFSLDLIFFFSKTDALSKFEPTRFVEYKHSGGITRDFAHRKITRRLSSSQSITNNKFTYYAKRGNTPGTSKPNCISHISKQ